MTKWLKTHIVAVIAILVSISAVGISGIKFRAADSTQINLRVATLENQIKPLADQMNVITYKMEVVTSTITNHTVGIEDLSDRTRALETTTAVNNVVLTKLTEAVTALNKSTKQLTKTMTAVAVLDTKVETLTKVIEKRPYID